MENFLNTNSSIIIYHPTCRELLHCPAHRTAAVGGRGGQVRGGGGSCPRKEAEAVRVEVCLCGETSMRCIIDEAVCLFAVG